MQRISYYDERNKSLLLNLGKYGIQELVFCSIGSENKAYKVYAGAHRLFQSLLLYLYCFIIIGSLININMNASG